ncbi:ABC transporter permease [Metaclostridioides mangenotii]|uniref:ABC transporter permease n=1 Tax=Metaclostridioides mangenotii TaxID=1540 RepID=UPI0004646144|nr:ABC transporter permease [Clostridioides mangenotii]
MKTSIMGQNKYRLLSIIIILAVWQGMSVIYSPIIVPSINEVLKALIDILTTKDLLVNIFITTKRLIIALTISVSLGSILGIIIGYSKKIELLINPVISFMQSVPPISWLVLAIIWFGLDGKASIFIAVISTLPLVVINLVESIKNIDHQLVEMGEIYCFSKSKMLRKIIIPSIIPYFQGALQVVIGLGWKIIVMGEVLSSNNGIGGELTISRINIETGYVFAWTIIIVVLFYTTNKVVSYLFNTKVKGERYAFKDRKFN